MYNKWSLLFWIILSIFLLVVDVEIDSITAKPYIPQKSWFHWICSKFFVLWHGHDYSGGHISWHELFLAENQGNHENFVPSLVSPKLWLIWKNLKQKKNFFWKKKNQNGRLKKTEFFNHHQKLSNCRQNFMDWSLG